MTTLLIVDDQELVRVGLRKILDGEPDMTVVGEAGDGEQAVAEAARLRPEVVLMDVRMPVLDGIEATRRIIRAGHSTRVMILTTFGLDGYVYDALRAGASGFMLKDARPEEIAAAVRIVASGDALLAPAVTRAVIEEFARQPAPATEVEPPAAVAELTPREQEVLALLVRGLSNPEICEQLVISEATAKTHVAHILQKLGLRDRVQAVIYAYESGLVAPGGPQRRHGRALLAAEADGVQVLLAHLVDAREQVVEIVVLGMKVAARKRVVSPGRERRDEPRSQLRRRPGRVIGRP